MWRRLHSEYLDLDEFCIALFRSCSDFLSICSPDELEYNSVHDGRPYLPPATQRMLLDEMWNSTPYLAQQFDSCVNAYIRRLDFVVE